MKKLFLLCAMFGMVGFVSAQSCSKSMAAGDKKCCAKTAAAAASLASLDNSIEKKVCEESGKVSYFQTSVCEVSGKESVNEVKYCDKSKKFVNVSPSAEAKKDCSKKCTKGAKEAKATGVSNTKACTKGAKSCEKACSKKAKSAAAASAQFTSTKEN